MNKCMNFFIFFVLRILFVFPFPFFFLGLHERISSDSAVDIDG
jgi:hypothetical protein